MNERRQKDGFAVLVHCATMTMETVCFTLSVDLKYDWIGTYVQQLQSLLCKVDLLDDSLSQLHAVITCLLKLQGKEK